MKKVYHRYELWEDNKAGMYFLKTENEEEKIKKSKWLLSHYKQLKKYMILAVTKWIYSPEMNMSNRSLNRQAWLGKSACCLYCGAPEYITAQAWKSLTDNQREKANKIADEVIKMWEGEHEKRIRS